MAWQPTPKKKKEKRSSPSLPQKEKNQTVRGSYTIWFTHHVLIYYYFMVPN
jgi:hypothetical protein